MKIFRMITNWLFGGKYDPWGPILFINKNGHVKGDETLKGNEIKKGTI